MRKKFPDITQKELEYKVEAAIGKTTVDLDDAVYKSIFLLPKEQVKKFWKGVEKILPNYKQSKEWLRIHGNTLNI